MPAVVRLSSDDEQVVATYLAAMRTVGRKTGRSTTHPQLKGLLDDWVEHHRPDDIRTNRLLVEHHRPISAHRVAAALHRLAADAGIGHVTAHQLRHTLATQAINRGMSLDAIAPLLGHKTLAMTMVYARIADRTVAEQYFSVTEKVEALYDQSQHLPHSDEGSEMRKLRAEMHRRMLENGYCARPVEMDCHFESICESCSFFVTTIRVPTHPASPTRRRREQGPSRQEADLRQPARTAQHRRLMNAQLDTDHPQKYNNRRLHGSLGMISPTEFEDAHYAALNREAQPV